MTEQQLYDVVEQHDGFELRRYPSHLVAEVTVRGSFGEVGNQAFRALFGYISGRNEARRSVARTAPLVQQRGPSERVAMTAPVVQSESANGDYVVAFVLPSALTEDTAPVPTNPDVRLRAVPEQLAAAVRYSGRWSEAAYQRHLDDLHAAIVAAGLVPIGPARFARFDPPFTPWFLRRNEVVQDVTRPQHD